VADHVAALIGRRTEVSALSAALTARQSRLIAGDAGVGKTRLLQESLSAGGQPFISIPRPHVLHDLLVGMAELLDCRSGRFGELRRATTLHLKPLVLNALRANPRCVVLENVEAVEARMYRFLQEVCSLPDTCLVVTTRSKSRIGHLRKLLWDPGEELALKPLTRQESLQLFEEACRAFGLHGFDVDEFRNQVLRAARGNPGQILGMCRLAGQPAYQSGNRIRFGQVRMDVLPVFLS
jgi:hypothetical protein